MRYLRLLVANARSGFYFSAAGAPLATWWSAAEGHSVYTRLLSAEVECDSRRLKQLDFDVILGGARATATREATRSTTPRVKGMGVGLVQALALPLGSTMPTVRQREPGRPPGGSRTPADLCWPASASIACTAPWSCFTGTGCWRRRVPATSRTGWGSVPRFIAGIRGTAPSTGNRSRHPHKPGRKVLQVRRLRDPLLVWGDQGAVGTYPAARAGSLTVRVMFLAGRQGGRIHLPERRVNPKDLASGVYSM